jgi:hypothetical protein
VRRKPQILEVTFECLYRLSRSALILILIALTGHLNALAASPTPPADRHFYLPSQAASKIVTVTRQGEAAAEVIVLTQPVAIKETGPKETINVCVANY